MKSSHPLCSTQSSSTYVSTAADFVYRKVLRQAAAAICKQAGFDTIESQVLELITHMMNSYLLELGISTRLVTEVAGRTVSTPSDTILGLIEIGCSVMDLPTFLAKCRSQGTFCIVPPKVQNSPNVPSPLRVGNAQPHPPHIPDSLPPFPDPHTYRRTEIAGDPELVYEKVREDSAMLKRNTDVSLRDFMLRIHPSISLFGAYEQSVRKEARAQLEIRARQRKARIRGRMAQLEEQKLNQELKSAVDEDMLELFESTDNEPHNDETEVNGPLDDLIAEEMFELDETETSLVRRKVPAICQVLEPCLDSRPYLSALLSDELGEEGSDQPASPPPPTSHSNSHNNNHSGDEETTTEGNPYLRLPRLAVMAELDAMDY
uniref:Transcription initiation factor TFIID subunit 8 n=1 Tax=Syphacia muris TaxID=451379 RepID=A0A0N5ALF0_9BILA